MTRKKSQRLDEAQEAELLQLGAQNVVKLIEVDEAPDARDPVFEEAENRLEQDLLMAMNGFRPRAVVRRIARYRKAFADGALAQTTLVERYRKQVLEASAAFTGREPYIPGNDIPGDALRSFAAEPIITGPLVCQLCDEVSFLYDLDFAAHKQREHAGEAEYRKRVLFLLQERGCRAITGQEKRIMVQNFAHFQQYSRPGTGANTFARTAEVPRCEAACVICQRKDWIEQRHEVALFKEAPSVSLVSVDGAAQPVDEVDESPDAAVSDEGVPEAERRQSVLLKHENVYYLQNAEAVHACLNVERYAARWPLIPREELHASSIQHPSHPDWRWLLHVRRVPVKKSIGASQATPDVGSDGAGVGDPSGAQQLTHESPTGGAGVGDPSAAPQPTDESPPGVAGVGDPSGASQPTSDTRPACAGVGDPDNTVWMCWECLEDLGGKKPKMPIYACANDNWIGRERQHVRDASWATKMLASLARCCWKQVRLGRHTDPDVQEKALTGNTIFFAQPTADVPSMELPPPPDALVDSFNVLFTRGLHDLSKAEWAVVDRAEYLRRVGERKQQCTAFSHVVVRNDLANSHACIR